MSSPPLHLFAACLPGLEPLLADEIAALGIEGAKTEAGGVSFRGDARTVFRANLELGLASHVLLRIATFGARSLGELARKSSEVPWRDWLLRGVPLAVRARSRKSRLYHTGAIEQRVREGVAKAMGDVPAGALGDTETVSLTVRFADDTCTISLDTSGAPLHRRGFRLAGGKAPLREDLARALVIASGWDRQSPLVDPFCGSGTIPLEAAALARRLPPGHGRSFAFGTTALFDEALWNEVRERAESAMLDSCPAPIFGSDRVDGAIEASRANAARAGLEGDVTFVATAFSGAPLLGGEPEAPPTGAVVTNPPFGKRVGKVNKLLPVYQRLGERLRALPEGWRVALLATDRRLALSTGLALKTAFLTDHGGIKVRALVAAAGDATPPKSTAPTAD